MKMLLAKKTQKKLFATSIRIEYLFALGVIFSNFQTALKSNSDSFSEYCIYFYITILKF